MERALSNKNVAQIRELTKKLVPSTKDEKSSQNEKQKASLSRTISSVSGKRPTEVSRKRPAETSALASKMKRGMLAFSDDSDSDRLLVRLLQTRYCTFLLRTPSSVSSLELLSSISSIVTLLSSFSS